MEIIRDTLSITFLFREAFVWVAPVDAFSQISQKSSSCLAIFYYILNVLRSVFSRTTFLYFGFLRVFEFSRFSDRTLIFSF